MKCVANGLFLLAFLLVQGPLLSYETTSSPFSHWILQGFSNKFTTGLGVQDSLYEWAPIYSDAWPNFQIRTVAFLEYQNPSPLGYLSDEYNTIGMYLLKDIYLNFPADILLRSYAAILKIIKLPLVFSLLLLFVSWYSLRLAIGIGLLTVYFTAYPMIQFAERHFFYLEFFPLWIIGFGLHFCWRHLADALRILISGLSTGSFQEKRLPFPLLETTQIAKVVLLGMGTVGLIFLPVFFLRWYQEQNINQLFSSYAQAQLTALEPIQTSAGEDTILISGLRTEDLLPLPMHDPWQLFVGYLAVKFSSDTCPTTSLEVTLRYEKGAYHDFSRTISIQLISGMETMLYTPIYSRLKDSFGDSLFQGLEVPISAVRCIQGLYTLQDLDRFVPLLQIHLPGNWKQRRLYQTLKERDGWKEFSQTVQENRNRWRRIRSRLEEYCGVK